MAMPVPVTGTKRANAPQGHHPAHPDTAEGGASFRDGAAATRVEPPPAAGGGRSWGPVRRAAWPAHRGDGRGGNPDAGDGRPGRRVRRGCCRYRKALFQDAGQRAGGIFSTTSAQTDFPESLPMRRISRRSDFHLSDFRSDQPLTVYLVLPAGGLDSHFPVAADDDPAGAPRWRRLAGTLAAGCRS